ncbi:alpha/beta hydrolase family protein [Thauera linaloolentis]|uniref:alpha/beta hydrolase family protein n=1 Tax=Thauera linaloolentis TaxID=76112 RepID=UPI0002F80C78|nr:hypothetical protein [Thauera linaloolentis]MCM8567728.1 hypothetical protein [Thauera linaloolentis]
MIIAMCLGIGAGLVSAMEGEASRKTRNVPVDIFADQARGPYRTGTFEVLWVNEALDDPSTTAVGDSRKVMVQLWYPASSSVQQDHAPYAISPQLYGESHWVHQLGGVRTRSVLNAPVVEGRERLPVLIYNHGAMHPHFSGTFQTEFLASHGYVVVAIGHPGANEIERFPDGKSYRNDGMTYWAEPPTGERPARRELAEYLWAHGDLSLFIGDIRFVLDRLAALDIDPEWRLRHRLALDRVGSLGWSLGGFLSLQAGRDEPRIKAVANLDGLNLLGLMGPRGVATLGSERPMLLMFADRWTEVSPPYPGVELSADIVERMELRAALVAHYWRMLRRSTADWYYMSIAGVDHAHFSDRTLFETIPEDRMSPRQAHDIINRFTLEFFEKYLRGSTQTPLLDGEEVFAEAGLFKMKGDAK